MPDYMWIEFFRSNGWNEWTDLKCPVCGETFEKVPWPDKWKRCPVCETKLTRREKIDNPCHNSDVHSRRIVQAVRNMIEEEI